MKQLIFFISLILIFTACSSKEYFEPEKTLGEFKDSSSSSLNSDIFSMNKDGATLNNREIITTRGISKFKIPEGYKFLNMVENTVISSNYKDTVLVGDKKIVLDAIVIAANIQDDKLALLFSDNSIMLYDMNLQKAVLREYFSHSFVNDTRIANPYFMSNIILFPTLDGKIVVVSKEKNKIIRNIVVDANGKFNNIIFLDVIDNTLVAATSNKVISVGDGVLNLKDYSIRDIITKNKEIFIATIDGQIIQTDISLNIMNRKKYKFAKFYALAYGESLYALESQGFLIKISKDFKTDWVYDFDFNNTKRVIALDNTIYFGDEYIILK